MRAFVAASSASGPSGIVAQSRYDQKHVPFADVDADPSAGSALAVFPEILGRENALEFARCAEHVRGRSRTIVPGANLPMAPPVDVRLAYQLVTGFNSGVDFGGSRPGTFRFTLMENGGFARNETVFVTSGP
jgi:hypothetical protein